MRRVLTSLAAFSVGLGGSFAVANLSGSSETPDNGDLLGDANFDTYCRRNFGDRSAAVLTREDAYGWRCTSLPNGIFSTTEVDLNALCVQQFGSPSYPNSWDTESPYSWQCLYGSPP